MSTGFACANDVHRFVSEKTSEAGQATGGKGSGPDNTTNAICKDNITYLGVHVRRHWQGRSPKGGQNNLAGALNTRLQGRRGSKGALQTRMPQQHGLPKNAAAPNTCTHAWFPPQITKEGVESCNKRQLKAQCRARPPTKRQTTGPKCSKALTASPQWVSRSTESLKIHIGC